MSLLIHSAIFLRLDTFQGADEDKTANVDTLAEAAPAAPADGPIPEGVHEGILSGHLMLSIGTI